MSERIHGWKVALSALVLVAAIVAGQALTGRVAPAGQTTGTGASVGRAAFSYLSGMRAFAAYVLWNRIEPQQHSYYEGESLKDERFAVPTMVLVIALKPDFVPPYYILPWMLVENGKVDQGLALAKQGVEANPRSGLLLMSYAQILTTKRGDWRTAAAMSDRALRSDTVWTDDTEEYESLRVAEDVYLHLGEKAKAAQVAAMLTAVGARIDQKPTTDALGASHDHNGDGVPDH